MTQASAEVVENPPVNHSPEVFIAQNEGLTDNTVEQVGSEDGTVQVTHNRPGRVWLYKPTERNGWVPRQVTASSIGPNLKNGWREFCGDCNQHHIDKKGNISTDPNLCSARDPVAVRLCPVCDKRIYDNTRFEQIEDDGSDLNVIREENLYEQSTGASRTKRSLEIHLWVRHPLWAQMHDVPPLPAALRDMVEEVKA